jgi:hypothetical protein
MLENKINVQDASNYRKKYKLGGSLIWKSKLFFAVLLMYVFLYFISDILLSDNIEWHLISKKDGPIIPNIYIKMVWYTLLFVSVLGLIQVFIPYSNIIIDKDNIAIQNFFTRRFKTAPLSEIVDVKISKNSIKLFSLNNGNLHIPVRMLTKKDFIDIRNRISRSANLI